MKSSQSLQPIRTVTQLPPEKLRYELDGGFNADDPVIAPYLKLKTDAYMSNGLTPTMTAAAFPLKGSAGFGGYTALNYPERLFTILTNPMSSVKEWAGAGAPTIAAYHGNFLFIIEVIKTFKRANSEMAKAFCQFANESGSYKHSSLLMYLAETNLKTLKQNQVFDLHLAIRLAIENGADPFAGMPNDAEDKAGDRAGKTALDFAFETDNELIAKWMLDSIKARLPEVEMSRCLEEQRKKVRDKIKDPQKASFALGILNAADPHPQNQQAEEAKQGGGAVKRKLEDKGAADKSAIPPPPKRAKTEPKRAQTESKAEMETQEPAAKLNGSGTTAQLTLQLNAHVQEKPKTPEMPQAQERPQAPWWRSEPARPLPLPAQRAMSPAPLPSPTQSSNSNSSAFSFGQPGRSAFRAPVPQGGQLLPRPTMMPGKK